MNPPALLVVIAISLATFAAPVRGQDARPTLTAKQKRAERHVHMARYYLLQESDRKAAIRELQKAVTADPSHVNATLALASLLVDDKQPGKAVPLLKRLAQKQPSASVLLVLGDAEFSNGNQTAGLAAYQAACELEQTDVEPAHRLFLALAAIYKEGGQQKQALVAAARQLISRTYPSAEAHVQARRTLLELTAEPLALVAFDAEQAYERAFTAQSPTEIMSLMSAAREGFESCLKQQPDNQACHLGLGKVYSSVKAGSAYDVKKARAHFDKAPDQVEAAFQLARMARLENDLKAADAAVKRGLAKNPIHSELLVEQAILLKLAGNESAALAILIPAYEGSMGGPSAERILGEIAAIAPDHEVLRRAANADGKFGGDLFSTERFRAAVSQFESEFGGVDDGAPEKKILEEVLQKILDGADADSQVRLVAHVLKSEEVNAVALPNGNVYFTRGFFDAMKKSWPDRNVDANNAVLGHVMGHEVAHVLRQHTLHSVLYQQAISDAASSFDGAVLTHVTRLQETEADRLGMVWASLAGFHPRGGIEFMEMQGKEMEVPRGLDHPTYDERVQYLEQYWSNDVKYAHVSFQLGLAAVEGGDKLVSINPAKARAQYDSAVEHFRRYRNTLLPTKRVLNNLGAAYARLGMLELAQKESPLHAWQTPFSLEKEAALKYVPVSSGSTRGGDDTLPGDLKRALSSFKEALKRDPSYGKARANLGAAYLLTGDLAAAGRALAGVTAGPLESGELSLVRGVWLAESKKYDDAEKAFRAAEKTAGLGRSAQYNLARLYGLKGDKSKARSAYAAYVKAYPADAWTPAAKKALATLGG